MVPQTTLGQNKTSHQPSPPLVPQFDSLMLGVKGFISFGLHSQQESHDAHTLRQMNAALKRFHHYKEVFFELRTNKSVNGNVGDLLKQLQEKLEENLDAKRQEELTTAALQKKNDEWMTYIENKWKEYVIENLDCNFTKIQLLLHFTGNVRQLSTLEQYLTEIQKSSNMRLLKDGCRLSN